MPNDYTCPVCTEQHIGLSFPAYIVAGERVCKCCAFEVADDTAVIRVYPDGKVAKGI